MKTKNYSIQTLSGAAIYTNGRSLSTLRSKTHYRRFESTEPSERMIAYWSKKLGEPVKAVDAGCVEVLSVPCFA